MFKMEEYAQMKNIGVLFFMILKMIDIHIYTLIYQMENGLKIY